MVFKIANLEISKSNRPKLIAEIGINHGGSLDVAKKMAELAVINGADIIKHQTHIVEDEMAHEANEFEVDYLKKSIFKLMDECSLSSEEEFKFKEFVEIELNSIFLSTPFSRAAANFLNDIGVCGFKIGSGECNNRPLIKHIANFKKPIILSTGMNDISSVQMSVDVLLKSGCEFMLMHTTNSYPCPDEAIRLNCVNELSKTFQNRICVGYSDHAVGPLAVYGAVAQGAPLIEKHFTDSFERIGPDIACSMDPEMCKEISNSIQRIFDMCGDGKGLVEVEKPVAEFAFASVCSTKNIQSGEKFTNENLWVRRPGTGDFNADEYEGLIGKTAAREIIKNTLIRKEDVKN